MQFIKRKMLASLVAVLIFVTPALAQSKSRSGAKKVLVAYYSDTGTTKGVAEKIAALTGADLLEIEIEKPYTSADLDYTNRNSRVCLEHERIFEGKGNGAATAEGVKKVLPALKTALPNFADYDAVFVGYPIWWGIAAWPVSSFAAQADFSDADVIPFCTSMSSPLGRSDKLLKEVSNGTGNWKAGKRFGMRTTESEVSKWLSEIGYGGK